MMPYLRTIKEVLEEDPDERSIKSDEATSTHKRDNVVIDWWRKRCREEFMGSRTEKKPCSLFITTFPEVAPVRGSHDSSQSQDVWAWTTANIDRNPLGTGTMARMWLSRLIAAKPIKEK
jgi:hypothetical protein